MMNKKRVLELIDRFQLTFIISLGYFYAKTYQKVAIKEFVVFFFWNLFFQLERYGVGVLNWIRECYLFQMLRKSILLQISATKARTTTIELPQNVRDSHLLRRFKKRSFYYLPVLRQYQLSNAFINLHKFTGVVLKGGIPQRYSTHGIWDKRMFFLSKNIYLKSFQAYVYCRYNRKVQLRNKKYLFFHDWFNYYHWMTESLERLWSFEGNLAEYTVLLPKALEHNNFVRESLKSFSVNNLEFIEEPCLVENLTVIQNIPYCENYYPQKIEGIVAHLIAYAKTQVDFENYNLGDSLFVSRQNAVRRRIANYEEIKTVLQDYHFIEVEFEHYTLWEQIAVMSHVKNFAGMHGTGLTNMMFMPANGNILELHRPLKSYRDYHSVVYWRFASVCGHNYYWQNAYPVDEQETFLHGLSLGKLFSIDIIELRDNLQALLAS